MKRGIMPEAGQLVKEIYDTVNRLNRLAEQATRDFGFTVQWDVRPVSSVGTRPYLHLDLTVLTPVEPG